jgi:ring-1,2-phenylacetyl-CoA epoxidase subunit PaaC
VKRLGLGTEESNTRMQAALDLLWPYTGQLTGAKYDAWTPAGVPTDEAMRGEWESRVRRELEAAGLAIPDLPMHTLDRDLQSGYIVDILAELQQVARLDPQAEW